MIIWLASYPRSGNTALRTILYHAFGINTYSLYDDKGDIGSRRALRETVGHASHFLDQQEFYAQASTSSETYFVKTHDAPQDDAKAIYVVRDGRAAAVSYFHYLKNFSPENSSRLLLKDVILGNCNFGSWSEHFLAWSPQQRPNTLLINFDDITDRPARVVESVANFIDKQPSSMDLPGFKDLQKADPAFFRSGNDASNIAEMENDDLCLFWVLHRDLMKTLGYIDSIPITPDLPQSFRQILTDLSERDQSPLKANLATSEADRAARLDVIYQHEATIRQLEVTIAELREESAKLKAEINILENGREEQLRTLDELRSVLARLQRPLWKKLVSKS